MGMTDEGYDGWTVGWELVAPPEEEEQHGESDAAD